MQKTAQQKSPIIKNLVGGLNVRESVTDIADNEAAAASNVVFYTAGSVVRRGAWIKLTANSPTANKLLGVFQPAFWGTYYLVVTDGTGIWCTTNPTEVPVAWADITGSAVTLDATQPYHFVMMNNIMVGYNGKCVFYWDGGTAIKAMPAATGTTAACPLSRCAIVWQDCLFWFGDSNTNPNRLWHSAIGDPTTYPADNWDDIPTAWDGDYGTGLAILYGNLLCFKRWSYYIVQGSPGQPGVTDNLIVSKLNSSVGCVDPASVVQIDNLVYFVSDKGLYAANLFNVQQKCYKTEPRYIMSVPISSPSAPIWVAHYKPKGHIFVAMNCQSLYSGLTTYNDRLLVHDYFNADQNGDPASSEFIVGYTGYTQAATKPLNPTAPFIMGDYLPGGTPGKNATVMSSFYDPFVYVFTDGQLVYGGPQDQVAWLTSVFGSAPTYPPTDWLSKFFDFGDPDMTKVVRWLWTTGQLYNGIPLTAGLVYNNSPTTASFVDFNSGLIEVVSPNGQVWLISVLDSGAFTTTPTPDNNFIVDLIVASPNAQNWRITVDNTGAPSVNAVAAGNLGSIILVSPNGYQFQLGVDNSGVITTTPVFTPATFTIVPGRRTFVRPIVGGYQELTVGKYVQFYFSGIGILSQFSMDIIMKGRRS